MCFAAVRDQWRWLIAVQITKNSKNPFALLMKTKNQMLNCIKSTNQNGENKKTKVFFRQKPENQSKLSQNCKTKNPNALLLMEEWYIPLASFCPWQHDTTLLNTAVKVTTWSFGENNSQMDLHSIVSPRVYFGMLCNILNCHWKYFNFFTSFFFLTIYNL